MDSIFMIYTDTADEGPYIHAFRSTLPLAVSCCAEIMQAEKADGHNLYIDEYGVDAPVNYEPNARDTLFAAMTRPLATYRADGTKA